MKLRRQESVTSFTTFFSIYIPVELKPRTEGLSYHHPPDQSRVPSGTGVSNTASLAGLEPATTRSAIWCSIQLNYRDTSNYEYFIIKLEKVLTNFLRDKIYKMFLAVNLFLNNIIMAILGVIVVVGLYRILTKPIDKRSALLFFGYVILYLGIILWVVLL